MKRATRRALGLFLIAAVPASLWLINRASVGPGTAATEVLFGPPESWNPVREHNDMIDAADERELAWPLLLDARVIAYRFYENHPEADFDDLDPAGETWAAVHAWTEQGHALIGLVGEAVKRPRLGVRWYDGDDPAFYERMGDAENYAPAESSENPLMLDVRLEQIGVARSMARHLRFDIRLALADGETDRAINGIESLIGLARLMGQPEASILDRGVSDAIVAIAIEELALVLDTETRVSEDRLTHLASLVASATTPTDPANGFGILVVEDLLRRAYHPDGYLTRAGLLRLAEIVSREPLDDFELPAGFAMSDVMPAPPLESVLEALDRDAATLAEHLKRPWLAPSTPELGLSMLRSYEVDISLVMRLFMWDVAGVTNIEARGNAIRSGLAAVLAVHRHRIRHGEWPASLETVDPEFLSEVPIDPFSGRPLGYRVDSNGPVIWSAGEDMDDDGGVPRVDADGAWVPPSWKPRDEVERILADDPASIDGDWVLFPPEE